MSQVRQWETHVERFRVSADSADSGVKILLMRAYLLCLEVPRDVRPPVGSRLSLAGTAGSSLDGTATVSGTLTSQTIAGP
jgi:hypothetical protein